MELIEGWTDYRRGCGCPSATALFVNTFSGLETGGAIITLHDPETGAFIGYEHHSTSGNSRVTACATINCLQYFHKESQLPGHKKISRCDAVTFKPILPAIPSGDLPMNTFYGGMDTDGINLWALIDDDPTDGVDFPVILKLDPADATVLSRFNCINSTRSPSNAIFWGMCYADNHIIVQQKAVNPGADWAQARGIFDKYDTAGNLTQPNFINITTNLTDGPVFSWSAPETNIVWTGTEFLIGDGKSNRIARCSAAGAFTGYTQLISPLGVGSDYDAGGTFRIIGLGPNPFALE